MGLWGGGGIGSVGASADPIAVTALIDEALRYAGITTGPGRTPSPDQRNDGLLAMRRMLNAWEAKRRRILTTIRNTFSLVAGTADYTIGPGGDWDTNRPSKIDLAGIVVSGIETPISVFDDRQWSLIADKTTSGIPYGIRYEATAPVGTVRVYPVPSSADTIALYVWSTMTAVTSLAESVDLAPAYADGIVFNLAVRLWQKFDEYHHMQPCPQWLRDEARNTLATIESLNAPPPPRLISDAPGTRRGGFDIRTGMFR